MNGDALGSPPWGPADPVPEVEDTQAIPGLGSVPPNVTSSPNGASGPDGSSGSNGHAGDRPAANGTGDRAAGGEGENGPDPAADPKDGTGGSTSSKKRRNFWRELVVLVVVALVLAVVIKTFAVQAFFIPSGSMEDTLDIGDRVLINKVVYHLRSIHRGDIVVFDGAGSWDFDNPPASSNIFSKAIDELQGLVGVSQDPSIYIKRVIGLPGDHVVCCNAQGQVTVNGVPLSESSYLYPGNVPSAQKFNITVPAGRLWVMGDHRLISYDSRGHMGDPGGGTIPESAVLGRAFVIVWPPSQWGFLNIPATFEQPQLNASTASTGNAAAAGSSTALEAALDNGTPIRPAASPIPLALGFIGAVPLTWLHRKARRRLRNRRSKDPNH
jgi:signal peptidase I